MIGLIKNLGEKVLEVTVNFIIKLIKRDRVDLGHLSNE